VIIAPRTRYLDVQLLQGRQRLQQASAPPIEHMVVGQYTAVDLGRRETFCILGAHAVVDALVRAVVAAGHSCFEIDDPRIRLHAL
jgi:hypothetical protein